MVATNGASLRSTHRPSPAYIGYALLRRQELPLPMRGHLISSGNQDVIRLIGNPETPPPNDTRTASSSARIIWRRCRTIASDADLRTLLLRSRQIKYDVIAIQETKGRTETILGKPITTQGLLHGLEQELVMAECLAGWSSSSDSHKIHQCTPIAVLRLLTKDQGAISIINGYAPTSTATDEEREEFYQLLEDTIRMRELTT
ncbi:hypothetical protein COOONC_07017, partial [Cooperia oncophora]